MKQFVLGIATACTLVGVITLSRSESASENKTLVDPNAIQIEKEEKNPWTSLKLNNDPEQFQFVVLADRTGGHRDKVFSRAVLQVNLLQPQFVMCVGDLIEGYTSKEDKLKEEWDEFDSYVKKFEMPFFYVAGNHDLTNKIQVAKWGERYGKRYYHFVYKDVLFLCLNSENPPDGMNTIDPEQQAWVAKTVEANKNVRWTFVFLHRPIWTGKDLEKNGWAPVEKALAGRKYNVFVGHVHRYQVYERNGTQYYQLATTGGGSRLRGQEYGEFDHIAWVTMKKETPVITQVMLDGILPGNSKIPDSDEKGFPVKKKPTHPVDGKLTIDGKETAGVTVTFYTFNENTEKYNSIADGLTDAKGQFQLSTYGRFDGCPVGEYVVTVVKTGKGYYEAEVPEKNLLPEKYTTPKTSPLKVTIKEGINDLKLDVTTK
jgi:serine/threonine-protein phosphatase CPPED1